MGPSEVQHLALCRDFCDCGTPDPLNEGHASSCPMEWALVEELLEVEEIAPTWREHEQRPE